MGHQSYVLLCTEITLSNPPVVQTKSSCDVHLLRSPWLSVPEAPKYIKVRKVFDLSRLHLALLGLSSSSQPDLLWLVTLPLKVKHFVVMYRECTLLIDAH